jgi:CRP/FNR family transcriptional regulator
MDLGAVKRVGLLSRMADDDLRALIDCCRSVPFQKDDEVLPQGGDSTSLFFVQDGLLHVTREAKGRRVLLGRLEPGSFFGEISLFDPGPTTAAVRAVSDGVLLELHREQLERFLAQRPAAGADLLVAILEEMARRMRLTDERLADTIFWGGLLR